MEQELGSEPMFVGKQAQIPTPKTHQATSLGKASASKEDQVGGDVAGFSQPFGID